MRVVGNTVSLFFNYDYKILFVNQMITAHKAVYNLFGYVIYHKPNIIFKSKSHGFHNRNIGSFRGNDNKMDG